jgi:hypothetical protein
MARSWVASYIPFSAFSSLWVSNYLTDRSLDQVEEVADIEQSAKLDGEGEEVFECVQGCRAEGDRVPCVSRCLFGPEVSLDMCQEFGTCTNPVDQNQETNPKEEANEAEEPQTRRGTPLLQKCWISGILRLQKRLHGHALTWGRRTVWGVCMLAYTILRSSWRMQEERICTWPASMEIDCVEEAEPVEEVKPVEETKPVEEVTSIEERTLLDNTLEKRTFCKRA